MWLSSSEPFEKTDLKGKLSLSCDAKIMAKKEVGKGKKILNSSPWWGGPLISAGAWGRVGWIQLRRTRRSLNILGKSRIFKACWFGALSLGRAGSKRNRLGNSDSTLGFDQINICDMFQSNAVLSKIYCNCKMQVVVAVNYLLHNIAFNAWVIHHNNRQVRWVIQKVSTRKWSPVTSTRWSMWSFFDSGTEFLIFCYLLVFAGISSFLLAPY